MSIGQMVLFVTVYSIARPSTMPLVAKSFKIPCHEGFIFPDMIHKAMKHIQVIKFKGGQTTSRSMRRLFIDWGCSELKNGGWGGDVSVKLHITPAAWQPWQHNWQEGAHCTMCHCPMWLLIPPRSLLLSHHFPTTAFFLLFSSPTGSQ